MSLQCNLVGIHPSCFTVYDLWTDTSGDKPGISVERQMQNYSIPRDALRKRTAVICFKPSLAGVQSSEGSLHGTRLCPAWLKGAGGVYSREKEI